MVYSCEFRELIFAINIIICVDSVILILILDGEEVNITEVSSNGQGKSQCWNPRLPDGSAPSSIHNDSSSSSSAGAESDKSSVLDSINGRTRDRILASDNDAGKADSKVHGAELWKLPDDRFDNADPVCNYVDFEDVQLNETLRSLMETKTPMLPSRLRTVVKPQPYSRPSAAFVEPQTVSTCHVGLVGTQMSARNVVPFPLSKRSNNTTEHDSDRVKESSQPAVYPPVVESHIAAVDPKGRNISGKGSRRIGEHSLLSELSSDVQSSAIKSSVRAAAAATAERDVFGHSVPASDVVTSPLLTVPDTHSLDSLIARYRNLRDCSAVDKQLADLKPVSHAEHLLSTSTALSNLTATSVMGTSKAINEHGPHIATQYMLQPTLAAPRVLQQSANNVDRVVADDDLEHDLCGDNFDDIRLSLQNISMDSAHTPVHASLQQKGQCCDLKLHTVHNANMQLWQYIIKSSNEYVLYSTSMCTVQFTLLL